MKKTERQAAKHQTVKPASDRQPEPIKPTAPKPAALNSVPFPAE